MILVDSYYQQIIKIQLHKYHSYKIKQEIMVYIILRHIIKNAVPTPIGCRTAFFVWRRSSINDCAVSLGLTELGKEI